MLRYLVIIFLQLQYACTFYAEPVEHPIKIRKTFAKLFLLGVRHTIFTQYIAISAILFSLLWQKNAKGDKKPNKTVRKEEGREAWLEDFRKIKRITYDSPEQLYTSKLFFLCYRSIKLQSVKSLFQHLLYSTERRSYSKAIPTLSRHI